MKIKAKFRKLLCFVVVLFSVIMINSNVYGVNCTISNTNLNLGGSSTLNINGSGYAGKYSISTSNPGIVSISSSSVFIDDRTTGITLTAGSVGTAIITVTPNDVASINDPEKKDTTPKSITVNVVKIPENNNSNKSANANLKTLQVNQEGLTPIFSAAKTYYTLTVNKTVNNINVTALPEDSKAKVVVTGNNNLKDGDNDVLITVTAENGNKKTYKIVVNRSNAPEKTNSFLLNLIVENATLSPIFSKENFEYDCGIISSDIKSLKMLVFPENEKAKYEIIGNDELVIGENIIKVIVTSEDESTTKEYSIKVNVDETVLPVPEILSYIETDNGGLIYKARLLWESIKLNWLNILMLVFIIIEFIQIVYLYKKNKNIKIEKNSTNNAVRKNKNINIPIFYEDNTNTKSRSGSAEKDK